MVLFDLYKREDLIALSLPSSRDAAYLLRQEPFAVITGQLQDVQDRSLLHIAEMGCSTHAVAFHKAVEDSDHGFFREPHIFPEVFCWGSENRFSQCRYFQR